MTLVQVHARAELAAENAVLLPQGFERTRSCVHREGTLGKRLEGS